MKHALLFALIASAAAPSWAQRAVPLNAPHRLDPGTESIIATPDTTTPARYVPLGLGDEWHYTSAEDTPFVQPSFARQVRVVGDTTVGSRTYRVLRVRGFVDGVPSFADAWYVRYDSASTRLIELYRGVEQGFREAPCAAGAPFDAVCPNGGLYVRGGYGRLVVLLDERRAPTDTMITSVKTASGPTGAFTIAAGLGPTLQERDGGSQWLSFARIGGVEYGRRLAAVWAAPPEQAVVAGLRAYPNPFSETLFVRGAGAAGEHVRLYDALGRLAHEQRCDAGNCTIETPRLAPGAYVLVAGRSGGHLTTRVLIKLK